MEVKPGNKTTEVGVIPDHWPVKQLGSALKFQVGFPFSSVFFNKSGGGVRLVKNRDLKSDDQVFHYAGSYDPSFLVRDGDVLIGMDGDFLPCLWSKGQALLNQRVGRIVPLRGLDLVFAYYYLQKPLKEIQAATSSTTVKHLSHGDVEGIEKPLPPLPEQRAISAALSDVDALLGGLDRLIAKKRDLQQAAMQHLLTGQTRLPGFHGEWEVKSVGDLASISKGTQLHSSETNPDGQFPHFNGGIFPSSFTDKFNTPAATIAISEGGNSCGYVQLVPQPFWCGGHCYAVVPKTAVNRFLFHALKVQQTAIQSLRVGSGLPNVQKTALADFQLRVPSDKAEQTAIAAVLSDMDAEVAALDARRDKAHALKQGMMQELLTGRTRLVKPEAARV